MISIKSLTSLITIEFYTKKWNYLLNLPTLIDTNALPTNKNENNDKNKNC